MENQEKSKRGRPPAFDADTMNYYKTTRPLIRTRRTLVNDLYGFKAVEMLREMGGVDFIADFDSKVIKKCIIVELGRLSSITSPEEIKQIARYICDSEAAGEHRTAHEWAKVIRRFRMNRKALTETVSDNSGGRPPA